MVQKAHTEVCARTRQDASAQKAEDAPITMDGENIYRKNLARHMGQTTNQPTKKPKTRQQQMDDDLTEGAKQYHEKRGVAYTTRPVIS